MRSLSAISIIALAFLLPHLAHASTLTRPANNLGLMGYWSFNEGAGSQAGDSSGQGKTGTLTGSPAWVSGKYGSALQFNNISQYVTTGYTIPAQSSATSFTWSAWVYLTSTGGTQVILGFRNGATWLKLTPSALEYGSGSIISNTLPANQWIQVTIVKNGSNFTYYQNGVSAGTATNAGSVVSQTFYIGSDPGFNDGTPHYLIDDVRVYNRPLGVSDIAALYKAGGARVKAPDNKNLAAYWSFNEGAGSQAGDMSGKGNSGAFAGSPAWVAGKFGRALQFNGSSNYVSKSSPSGLNQGGTARSLSAWIKINALGSTMVPFVYGSCSPNGAAFGVYIDTSSKLNFWGCGDDYATTYTVQTGVWYHIAITTVNGSSVALYVNGVLVKNAAPTNFSLVSPSGAAYLNAGSAVNIDAGNYYFNGSVDDLRYYNRTLGAAEVAALYKMGATVANVNTVTGGALVNGLVGYWSFNGADMASDVKDGSGQGNDGDLINYTATTSAETIGKVGQALTFNGFNNYVWATNPSEPSNAVTISAWVKLAAYVPWASILDRYGNENLDCLSLGFDPSAGNTPMFMWNNNAPFNNKVTADSSIPLNTWTHLAASSDGSTVTFYINGVAHGTAAVGAPCTGNIVLGANFPGGDEYLNGALDEVRLYNRALSAAEINQLYNAGK